MAQVFFHPCREIAEACKISERSVYRWVKYHHLPVFHTPSGALATSVGLLEQWARDRVEEERSRPQNGGRIRQGRMAMGKLRVRVLRKDR